MPLLTHTTPAPKRIALSCEFTKDQKAAEERLASAKMYEDVDLRGIPLLEFPASLLEQPTGAGVAQFDAATLGSMLAADRDAALRGELRSYLSQQKDARHKALASMTTNGRRRAGRGRAGGVQLEEGRRAASACATWRAATRRR